MNCSVIICTRNRARILEISLLSILQQDYQRGALEVLVVDNASTDRTRQVAEASKGHANFPVRYQYESRPGLSYARNCGIEKARGDVVIFIDDDAYPLSPKWAERLVSVYHDPLVCAAGGDLEPAWPDDTRPEWIHDSLIPPLGVTRFEFNDAAALHYPNYPWGANISFRKENVQQMGGFSTDLGWAPATVPVPGEETELCLRLEIEGKKIVYVPGAAVQHMISPDKLTEGWLLQRGFAQGISDAIIDKSSTSTFHIFLSGAHKSVAVLLHAMGALYFSYRKDTKMRVFCQYYARCAGAYLLRLMKLG